MSHVRKYNPTDYELGTFVDYTYPENIPDFAKGRPIVWRGSTHIGGLFSLSEYWQPHRIPYKFQDLVCYGYLSPDTKDHVAYDKRNGIVVCGDCDKPKVFNTFYCLYCGDFFIRDFVDTRFCPAFPYCWDCIGEYEWDFCSDHASPGLVDYAFSGNTIVIPPVGMNPTKYSDSDIEDFIANELGI